MATHIVCEAPAAAAETVGNSSLMHAEAPDIETSRARYASRFVGHTGRYLLGVQARAIACAMADLVPGNVLDVGGAHGQLVRPLQQLGWQVTVQGSDDECRRNLREIHHIHDCEFVEANLLALPFADKSFDVVASVRLLSHLENWPEVLTEMCRVARCAVVLEYPTNMSLNVLGPRLFGIKRWFETTTRIYTNLRRKELVAHLERNGFAFNTEVKQFVLPMVLHRVAGRLVRVPEEAMRYVGLTSIVGSPVILRADRRQA